MTCGLTVVGQAFDHVVAAVVRMVQQVEYFGRASRPDVPGQPDLFRHTHVQFEQRVAFQVADRNHRPVRSQPLARTAAERIEAGERLEVVARAEVVSPCEGNLPRQPVHSVHA